MDPLAAVIEIFVISLAVAVFGGTALLAALEVKMESQALKNGRVFARPLVGTAVQQVQSHTVQPANSSNPGNISKAA
jgi:hypothetical protein